MRFAVIPRSVISKLWPMRHRQCKIREVYLVKERKNQAEPQSNYLRRNMKRGNKVLLSWAIAGLLSGAATFNAFAEHHEAVHPSNSDVKDDCAGKDSCTGKEVENTPVATTDSHKESCKTKESCKGKGHDAYEADSAHKGHSSTEHTHKEHSGAH